MKDLNKRDTVYKLHVELFPEDWDFFYDSSSDAKDRKQGINPMRSEYVALHDCKRASLGLPPVNPSDTPTPVVREWIQDQLESLTADEVREVVGNAIEKCRSCEVF